MMDGLTDDEALQLAIKMSLEAQANLSQSQGPTAPVEAEVVETESETTSSRSHNAQTDSTGQPSSNEAPLSTHTSSLGILGLDRRKMEQERLARLGQRPKTTRSISPPPLSRNGERSSKRVKIEHIVGNTLGASTSTKQNTSTLALAREANSSSLSGSLPFPDGVIKRTWARGHPRSNDISIEEVLQKDKLRKAVLSSFQWDHEWLFRKLDIRNTDLLMVVQAKTTAEQDIIRAEGKDTNPRIKLCFPPMPGQVNCMHSKLMLLFYDSYLRIVVPSANLTEYDWGDDNRMENMAFIIDLPGPLEMPANELQPLEEMTPFAKSLHFFLKSMGVTNSLLDAMRRYDFMKTNSFGFVHTV